MCERAHVRNRRGTPHFRLEEFMRELSAPTIRRNHLEKRPGEKRPRRVVPETGKVVDIAFGREQYPFEASVAHEHSKLLNSPQIFRLLNHPMMPLSVNAALRQS